MGGSTKLESHTKSHKANTSTVRFLSSLPVFAKNEVAQAAALAVALDIRPLSFCDEHTGVRHFAKTLFEMGQNIPPNERINPKCYLLDRNAVANAVGDISASPRRNFSAQTEQKCLKFGGAVSV